VRKFDIDLTDAQVETGGSHGFQRCSSCICSTSPGLEHKVNIKVNNWSWAKGSSTRAAVGKEKISTLDGLIGQLHK
jgi:hypothetical protein